MALELGQHHHILYACLAAGGRSEKAECSTGHYGIPVPNHIKMAVRTVYHILQHLRSEHTTLAQRGHEMAELIKFGRRKAAEF
jgi:hypothetical protein